MRPEDMPTEEESGCSLDGACKTPMHDHVERFWRLLEEGYVHITVNTRQSHGFAGEGHWTSASFSDDVAKALVAERKASRPTDPFEKQAS